MKTSTLLFVLLLIQSLLPAQSTTFHKIDTSLWLSDFEHARRISVEKNLPIMLVFSGSDWCKPCIMLRTEILDSEEFIAFAREHLVLINADFPRQKKFRPSPEQMAKNEALAKKFNKTGQFPYVVLMKSDETILGTEGYHQVSPKEYIKLINVIINK